jgi:hypothetical protein
MRHEFRGESTPLLGVDAFEDEVVGHPRELSITKVRRPDLRHPEVASGSDHSDKRDRTGSPHPFAGTRTEVSASANLLYSRTTVGDAKSLTYANK